MRYQGRIIEWNDDRGFGFVQRHGDESGKVFVHFRAFDDRRFRPRVGDVVSYAIERDARGRPQASAARFAGVRDTGRTRRTASTQPRISLVHVLCALAALLALIVLAKFGWSRYVREQPGVVSTSADSMAAPHAARSGRATQVGPQLAARAQTPMIGDPIPAGVLQPAAAPVFTCSGKRYCSEMHSCAEAEFYLRNCPGTVSDGDGDGIPCEDQWCGR